MKFKRLFFCLAALLLLQVQTYRLMRLPLKRNAADPFANATVVKDSDKYVVKTAAKSVQLLLVPDVFQATDYTCGPASLTAVLNYYHRDYREAELAVRAKTNQDVGTQPENLLNAILQLGIQAVMKEGMTVNQLQDELSAGRPVILLLQAWGDDESPPYPEDYEDGHYVVAIGYDNEYIYYEDPWVIGSLTFTTKAELLSRWHGNSDQPTDRHVYNCGIIVQLPIIQTPPVIHMD